MDEFFTAFEDAVEFFEKHSQPSNEDADPCYREGHETGFWKGIVVGAGAMLTAAACVVAIVSEFDD